MQNQTPTQRTNDLYFAAFLASRGVALVGAERSGHNQIVFVFAAAVEEYESQQSAWLSGQSVSASAYASTIQHLKGLIVNKLKEPLPAVDVLTSRGRP
jgi:hypothetical protein